MRRKLRYFINIYPIGCCIRLMIFNDDVVDGGGIIGGITVILGECIQFGQ
jgi:hypothetical protein